MSTFHPPLPNVRVKPSVKKGVNGEHTVEFDRYMVVYSNNYDSNLSSTWRAGCTSIGCYLGNKFVGSISFYETAETMNGGYIDANGVLVMEYPVSRFQDVLRLLESNDHLWLLFVETDQQGNHLAHPLGAIMSLEKQIGS